MNIFIYFLWAIIGFGLAILFIKTQSWSVSIINPQYPKFSKRIIIGGAIIRWLIISLFLILTVNHSIIAMLILFFTFIITRLVILYRQQRLFV